MSIEEPQVPILFYFLHLNSPKLTYPIDAMIVSHFPHGPTVFFTLNNVSLRHDIASYGESTVSEQYPHLIFENFSSKLGYRIKDVLKFLFPVPKEDSKRIMTFVNDSDFISFRCVFMSSVALDCSRLLFASPIHALIMAQPVDITYS